MHKHKHAHMHMEGYHAFLLFPLWYHKEIRLTGIKYCIHPNKRWQFFQIYHLKNAGLPLNTYKMTHVLCRHSLTNWRFWIGVILYARLSCIQTNTVNCFMHWTAYGILTTTNEIYKRFYITHKNLPHRNTFLHSFSQFFFFILHW